MSGPGFTVPLGRAGRLWLTSRLAVARHDADLLDRKLRILLQETSLQPGPGSRLGPGPEVHG